MLYVIYGTDTHRTRSKLHELLDLAYKKRPGAELFKITSENWNETQFEELIVSQGLFEQKYTIVLDNLFEKKDIKNYILERLASVRESEQIFIMLESGIDAPSLKKIAKEAKQVQEFARPEKKKPEFNLFAITDGLLHRDKKNLWIDYVEFLHKGAVPEEIHGIFFWQIKSMILATKSDSQAETGLSPYVYKNALTGSRKYKNEELERMSTQLVEMTHKVRSGEGELSIMLEKWVLEI